ncbi:tail tube monomer [Synechococcus phage S-PM2]|uniref:Tail tube monomer n=1 Tax=Synechococcus phage S-PM2 TaxID=238854 RepID=Q5GQN5_BPSYP|nr:tail tube [Synechococcus phage S-PM2]CAF34167.1 tail tube monomer [Synechococcus phage S-PM2]CFW42257.1 tail tube monomer [Synechococcus phage S-PM2]
MATRLSNFIDMVGQGVKPNMFMVDIVFPNEVPGASGDADMINLLCKSAALPASNLGVIEVPFRGRTVKIAGDRTFDTWTATFVNDKEMKIRGYFEQWLEQINTHETNNAPLFTPSLDSGYARNLKVKQLEKNGSESGEVLREYVLYYGFPTNVSQIDVAYDSNDQIEEFTVEFQYSYWKVESGTTQNGVSGVKSGIGDQRLVEN